MKYLKIMFILMLFSTCAFAQQNIRSKTKKLIHTGNEMPTPQFLKDNLSIIEDQPFDGLSIFVGVLINIGLSYADINDNILKSERELLKSTNFQKFTDNFLFVTSCDKDLDRSIEFNWFNDSQWVKITDNIRMVSRFVNETGLKGIIWDPENYMPSDWNHPWTISDKYAGLTYSEIGKKVRQRGREWIQALQSEKQDIKILSTLLYTYTTRDSTDDKYALTKFFNDGILDGLNDDAQLIDGCESQYWATRTTIFPWWINMIKIEVPKSYLDQTDSKLIEIYKKKVQAGVGLYTNIIMGIDLPAYNEMYNMNLDTATKFKFLEHNIYNALLNSDEYVWLWNEHYNDEGINWWQDFEYKKEVTKTINSAKIKIRNHEALGYTLDNRDPELLNAKGFHIYEQGTNLNITTTDYKNIYGVGDSIRVNITSNDPKTGYVSCYVNGLLIRMELNKPFYFNLDTLPIGVYDINAHAYAFDSLRMKYYLIQSNFISIEVVKKVKPILSLKILNNSTELIACNGDKDKYLFCEAEASENIEIIYQWFKNGEKLPSQTDAKLIFPICDSSTSGIYHCQVSALGIYKTKSTGNIIVRIKNPTLITYQPENLTKSMGEYAMLYFDGLVDGRKLTDEVYSGNASIKWFKYISETEFTQLIDDNEHISGSNSTILFINKITIEDFGKYYAQITDFCFKTRTIIVELKEEILDIRIEKQPLDVSECEGKNIIFNVEASTQSSKSIKYQWFKNSTAINNIQGEIEGALSSELTIYGIKTTDSGEYYCRMELDSTNIVQQSEKVNLEINAKPEILKQPKNAKIKASELLSLEVEINNINESLKYQWYHNSIKIIEATESIFIKTITDTTDSGEYYCEITNNCGTLFSEKINVTVTAIPSDVSELQTGGYRLNVPVPTPTNNIAIISYFVPTTSLLKITICDIQGNNAKILLNQIMDDGDHNLIINTTELNILSGVYFIKLESNGIVLIQKVVVSK